MSASLIKSTSIMFTDVVGYSRMTDRDEKNALKLLDEHNSINPITTLQYSLSKDSRVSLIIYDLQGKIAAELVNDIKIAGYYSLTWNASIHASGIYFVKMQVGDPFEGSGNNYFHTQKIVLVK